MRDPSDDSPVVHITDHAYERAKERLSWKTSVLEKMAEKAYNDGICHKDTKGSLNKSDQAQRAMAAAPGS